MGSYSSFGFFRPQRWLAEIQHSYPQGVAIFPVIGSMWDALDGFISAVEGREANGRPAARSKEAGIFALNLAATIGDAFDWVGKPLVYMQKMAKLKRAARTLDSADEAYVLAKSAQDWLDDSIREAGGDIEEIRPFGHPKDQTARHVNRSLGYDPADPKQIWFSKLYDDIVKQAAQLIEKKRLLSQLKFEDLVGDIHEMLKEVRPGFETDLTPDQVCHYTPIEPHGTYKNFSEVVRTTALTGKSLKALKETVLYLPENLQAYYRERLTRIGVVDPVPLEFFSKQINPRIVVGGKETSFPGAVSIAGIPNGGDTPTRPVFSNDINGDTVVEIQPVIDPLLTRGQQWIWHSSSIFNSLGREKMLKMAGEYENQLFRRVMDPHVGMKETVRLVAELFYLEVHLYRFTRGTNSVALLTLHSILQAKGYAAPGLMRSNMSLDIAALTNDFDDFFKIFLKAWDPGDGLPYVDEKKGWGVEPWLLTTSGPSSTELPINEFSVIIPETYKRKTTQVKSFLGTGVEVAPVEQSGLTGTLTAVSRLRAGGILIDSKITPNTLDDQAEPDSQNESIPLPVMVFIREKGASESLLSFDARVFRPAGTTWREPSGEMKSRYFIPDSFVSTKMKPGVRYEVWATIPGFGVAAFLGAFTTSPSATPTPRSTATAVSTPTPSVVIPMPTPGEGNCYFRGCYGNAGSTPLGLIGANGLPNPCELYPYDLKTFTSMCYWDGYCSSHGGFFSTYGSTSPAMVVTGARFCCSSGGRHDQTVGQTYSLPVGSLWYGDLPENIDQQGLFMVTNQCRRP